MVGAEVRQEALESLGHFQRITGSILPQDSWDKVQYRDFNKETHANAGHLSYFGYFAQDQWGQSPKYVDSIRSWNSHGSMVHTKAMIIDSLISLPFEEYLGAIKALTLTHLSRSLPPTSPAGTNSYFMVMGKDSGRLVVAFASTQERGLIEKAHVVAVTAFNQAILDGMDPSDSAVEATEKFLNLCHIPYESF